MRPKTLVEKAMDKEITWADLPDLAPHCDPRILHKPEECKYCAMAVVFQDEREQLEVSNTGHSNRKWPCPADRSRASANLNAWDGNKPKL